jgi:hypothetical protein
MWGPFAPQEDVCQPCLKALIQSGQKKTQQSEERNTKCNLHYNMSMKYAPKFLSNWGKRKKKKRETRCTSTWHQPIETSEVAHMLMLLPFLETQFSNIVVSYMLVSPCK